MWQIGLPVTPKRHIFCRQILKTVDLENGTMTSTFLKQHRVNTRKWWKKTIFRCLWKATGRFLECRYISRYFTVRFPTVFKLFRYHVKAVLKAGFYCKISHQNGAQQIIKIMNENYKQKMKSYEGYKKMGHKTKWQKPLKSLWVRTIFYAFNLTSVTEMLCCFGEWERGTD